MRAPPKLGPGCRADYINHQGTYRCSQAVASVKQACNAHRQTVEAGLDVSEQEAGALHTHALIWSKCMDIDNKHHTTSHEGQLMLCRLYPMMSYLPRALLQSCFVCIGSLVVEKCHWDRPQRTGVPFLFSFPSPVGTTSSVTRCKMHRPGSVLHASRRSMLIAAEIKMHCS